jgi:DNA-binding NtrC family response regulator
MEQAASCESQSATSPSELRRATRRSALVVEDDPVTRGALQAFLEGLGFRTRAAGSLAEMSAALAAQRFDLMLLDLRLDDGSGLEALPEVVLAHPALRIVVVTAHASLDSAITAMRRGANDFVEKPIDPSAVAAKVERLFSRDLVTIEGSSEAPDMVGLIGSSPAMRRVREQVLRMKDVNSTVLIHGESGTGKEVVARLLHRLSRRAQQPFGAINCAAIPETLLEAELFGARKGAYTDAKVDRKGLFETCTESTLLLDEIGEMPLGMQAKLLRVLQEKEITPLGSARAIKVGTRVIAATNRRLEELVSRGAFRQDLFYRLSVLEIELPPLRDREGDIPLLARHFVRELSVRLGRRLDPPSPEALTRLCQGRWPGNVRQLQNALERAAVLSSDGSLDLGDLLGEGSPETPTRDFATPLTFGSLKEARDAYEAHYLVELLKATRGNIQRASEIAGRGRTDMYRLFAKHGIDAAGFKH